MSSHTIEDLTSSILDFQANIVRLTYRRKTTPVDADLTSNAGALEFIWRATKLSNGNGNGGGGEKWVQLGFEGENLRGEFARVGLLGLDCLVSIWLD
jgi:engulfment/cell motility protein 1